MPGDRPQLSAAGSRFYDPKFRRLVYQSLLLIVIVLFFAALINNVVDNLARNRITSGFAFLRSIAGFDISQTLIPYSLETSTYARAFWVGLLNTLLVSVLGIIFATMLGFFIGIARLSNNWLVAKVAGSYVEIIRNIPLLLQLLFWYNSLISFLPDFRQSLSVPGGGYLNSRGLFLARPAFDSSILPFVATIVFALVAAFALRFYSRKKAERTGTGMPMLPLAIAGLFLIPVLVLFVTTINVEWTYPTLNRFNIGGGIEILPEFVALLFGLVIYTAAFIAEAVRAGLLSVSRGQVEAAAALGLRRRPSLKLVIIPQAKRVIIPPLTNQYLNLTKNSTLAVAIGYPDFVQIFTGTVLTQTGQAVEVVAITLSVYLFLSLVISLVMNIYQSRVTVVQR